MIIDLNNYSKKIFSFYNVKIVIIFFLIFLFFSPLFSNSNYDIIYFILTDRFNDANPENNFNVDKNNLQAYHGGDLKGIIEKIPYLKSLGITSIWISPVNDNRDKDFFGGWGYHGYWIKDFMKMEEHFGTIEDLQKLSAELHKNDIKLILDIVLNHTEWDAPLTSKKSFFHNNGDIKNWNLQKEIEENNLSGLPDLNQDNPEVYEFLLNEVKYWIKISDCDGIRLDAVKHISHTFWKKFLKDIKEFLNTEIKKPGFIIIGEVLNGDVYYLNDYFNDGFDYLFDFPLYYSIKKVFKNNGPMWTLSSKLKQDAVYENQFGLSQFLDNHDVERFFNNDINSMKLALDFIFTIRGIPTIYYGTEVPFSSSNEIDGRQDMIFDTGSELFKYISYLSSIRKEKKVFSDGQQIELYVDDDIYAFERINENEEAIIVLNNSGQNKAVEIPLLKGSCIIEGEELVDLLSLEKSNIKNNKLCYNIKFKSGNIFYKKCNVNHKEYIDKLIIEKKTQKNTSENYIEYNIKIKNDKTAFGEQIYIIGDIKELGNWNPENAVGPFSCPDWPVWEFKIKLPANQVIEFKFITKDDKRNIKWESGNNRLLNTSKTDETELNYIFNQ